MRRLGTALAALVALPLLVPVDVRGEADGGGSSVFSFGAGNRALALGGAYTSIGGDASAVVWNPAGLAIVPRKEFQGTQASLYGLDVSEQYGAFALPSWRWGTAAVGFRRFAVDGIEQRDDRNVLLSGDLSDSQTEFKVSYARTVSDHWNLGGSVKMHRQNLAGFSDFGVGLDLGALVKPALVIGHESAWARRLDLGVAVRNAIEPSLRLDQESVPDPIALRGGVSYSHPFLENGTILGAIDVEKQKDRNANLHLGLEVVPHEVLALRAGLNDGRLTAGAGIRWKLYSFDYVYEDNEFDSVQRFGLTLGFGATVAETRLAAQQAEENEFRERLAATFAERQAERVRELLEQGRSLLEANRVEDALGIVATVAALEPDNEEARALETECLFAQAGLEEQAGEFTDAAVLYGRVLAIDPNHFDASVGLARCRAESNMRAARSAQIREMFATALDAFTAGDLVTARDGFAEILDVEPGDAEAKAMLARTGTAIDARVTSLIRQAGRFVDRRLLPEAEELLEEARALDSRAPGLAALGTRIVKAEREVAAEAELARKLQQQREIADSQIDTPAVETVATAPAPPKGPVLSRKKRKEVEDLYRRGMEAMEADRADDALHYWELVWLADPEYQNVAAYLKDEYLLRGLESFSRGSLEEAITLWEKALQVDPDDGKTLGYLDRAREQLSRTREILGTGQ